MPIRKLFIILFAIQTLVVIIWYFLFYQPQDKELEQLNDQVELTFAKLKSAKKAQLDLRSIEKRLTEEQIDLENVRQKFLKKDELEKASNDTERMAKKFGLTLTEFSPVLENYLATADQSRAIKGFPLVITVKGRYINIGKFIDNWDKLPFYMTPDEIDIIRLEEGSNELQAMITGTLYAFNY